MLHAPSTDHAVHQRSKPKLAAIVIAFGTLLGVGTPSVRADTDTPGATATRVLSDEWTHTRWAYPAQRAVARSEPRPHAAPVGRLHFLTEDQLPEVYLLLEQHATTSGMWVRLRLPARPRGRTGWVPREALGAFQSTNTALLISRAAQRLTLYRAGRRVLQMPVGVGAASTPTPAGRYWIREKFRIKPGTLYGPRALGTSAYATVSDWPHGGVVGLHGTDRPDLVPGRPSHGCIRLRNADITRLYALVPRGTPVRII